MLALGSIVQVTGFSGNTANGTIIGRTFTSDGLYDVKLSNGEVLLYVPRNKLQLLEDVKKQST